MDVVELRRNQYTVLLVEDTEWFAEFMVRDLKEAGFQALWAPTWREADPLLIEADLLILDLWLPDAHGHEILAEALRRNPLLPAIILSADSSISAYRDSLERGAVMHFAKGQYPRQRDELFAHIDAHLKRVTDPFQIDHEAGVIRFHGEMVPLSRREQRLAAYFIQRPNQLISEETLREEAFGARVEGESVVRTAIS